MNPEEMAAAAKAEYDTWDDDKKARYVATLQAQLAPPATPVAAQDMTEVIKQAKILFLQLVQGVQDAGVGADGGGGT